MNQGTFAERSWDGKGKTTRREKFLQEMAVAVPWRELEALIEPVAPNEHLTPKKKPVGGDLTDKERARNRRLCSKGAKGEHPFRIVKCLFGYRNVRYKGIFKNFMHQTTLFLLSNLYLLRRLVQKNKIRSA